MYFALNSQSGIEECGFDDLNYISCGGAPLPVETVKTFEKKTGDLLVFFPTKMAKAILDYSGDRILERTPVGRFGSDDDIKGPALS